MKLSFIDLIRYDADDGKVFDWANLSEHIIEEELEDGTKVEKQDHLYAKTLFIGSHDNIRNYIEVDEPVIEEEVEK